MPMPLVLTVEQVATLAPDPASLSAGRKLAAGRVWKHMGHDGRALWGECQGSALYQVRVDLNDFAAKCSCPSRKFPCKHALGLLLMAAASPMEIPDATAPEWVADWLGKRGEAAQKKETKAEAVAATPVDEKAQAQRVLKRAARVDEGLDALDLWISDLIRNGLGSLADQGESALEGQASRMVDAQAPGIAGRLRRIASLPRTPDWSQRVLVALGDVVLLIEAFRRIDTLDAPLQDDVRTSIGWTVKDEEVTARGIAADDRWLVIGQRTEDDGRLRTQRSWLLGLESRRYALVLQFAAGTAPFSQMLIPGTAFEARLRYWPSAHPSRALIEERRGSAEAWSGIAPGFEHFSDLLSAMSHALAAQPWLDLLPCVVRAVRPARTAESWHLVDAPGRALPLATADHWKLAALSGGNPVDVSGEWNGETFLPLGAFVGDTFERLGV